MMELPNLEDAFNTVLIALENIAGVNYQNIKPDELEGQTLLLIAGLKV